MTQLFTPTALGGLHLPNRFVMAPMTRNRATADGVATDLMATYYAQRASAGLIIAEASTPNVVGQTYPDITAIHQDKHVTGWRKVTDAVHAAGGSMFLQLQHGGRVGHPDNSGHAPVAPSPIPLPDTIFTSQGHQPAAVPREMSTTDIESTVADFAAAAGNAIAAGFAGVEVHSANGYLLHQFLAQNTNRRGDEYGGTARNRVRFTARVVRAVAAAIGAHRVGLRVSPGFTKNSMVEGDTDRIYPTLLDAISDVDLAYLHVGYADEKQPLFHQIRRDWSGTLLTNPVLPSDQIPADGGLGAARRLANAGADLISLGRPFLANPDLVDRLRGGLPVNPVRGGYLMYVGGATGYTDYPTWARAPQPAAR